MESKHTPTPWSKRDIEIVGPYLSNKSICEITGSYMNENEAMANLSFIVTACNAHDELVKQNEILKGSLQIIIDKRNNSGWDAECAALIADDTLKYVTNTPIKQD